MRVNKRRWTNRQASVKSQVVKRKTKNQKEIGKIGVKEKKKEMKEEKEKE